MKEEYREKAEDSKTKKKSGLVSILLLFTITGVGFLGVHFWEGYKALEDYEERIKRNMAPNSVYFKESFFGKDYSGLGVFGIKDDVDGDGRCESVLKIENPNGEIESRIIEYHEGKMILRKFKVIDNKINYLTEIVSDGKVKYLTNAYLEDRVIKQPKRKKQIKYEHPFKQETSPLPVR